MEHVLPTVVLHGRGYPTYRVPIAIACVYEGRVGSVDLRYLGNLRARKPTTISGAALFRDRSSAEVDRGGSESSFPYVRGRNQARPLLGR